MKEKNVINYYIICHKLKNIIRTGWKNWNVKSERLESVAEHIYGTQMLAIGMYSEYSYDIDIMKVIYMLAIHELGESLIGDLTSFQIEKEEKIRIEHEAVKKILSNLIDGKNIEEIFLEFDEHKTKESIFAYQCDKLECDLQCKIYDQMGCVDINSEDSKSLIDIEYKELKKETLSWSKMWMKYDKSKINFDEHFTSVLNYVMDNEIDRV